MSIGIPMRARWAARGWPIAAAPGRYLAYAGAIIAATLGLWVLTLANAQMNSSAVIKALLLLVLAVGYEEGARRAAALQLRLKNGLRHDMTSVWSVAAAVSLPAGLAAGLLAALLCYQWIRQQRRMGKPAHRAAFNTANAMLSVLTAGAVLHLLDHVLTRLPWTLSTATPILIAIVGYTIVNRVVVTLGLLLVGVRGSALVGSVHDNLVEFATLCLGGLVALAVLYEPWLTVLAIAPMITLQRGALVRELEAAATTDSKTGLYNAVTWEQIATRELGRAQRTETSTAVVIIDLDRFKLVNDHFGHLAGDRVLRAVGNRLRAEVREYDTIGRFGGEEFVAVLPNAGDADALVVAERMRSRVNEMWISDFVDDVTADADHQLAVSIGVACAPVDGDELTELLHAADGALYRAKNLGRNRVMLADRGTGESTERVTAS